MVWSSITATHCGKRRLSPRGFPGALLRFEAGILRPPFKEVDKRLFHIHQHLLQDLGHTRTQPQMGGIAFQLRQVRREGRIAQALTRCLVVVLLAPHGPIWVPFGQRTADSLPTV